MGQQHKQTPSVCNLDTRRKRLKKNQSIVVFVSSSNHDTVDLDSIRVKRKTLQNLLDDCHRAPELLNLADTAPSGDRTETGGSGEDYSNPVGSSESPSSDSGDPEAEKDFSSRRFAFFFWFVQVRSRHTFTNYRVCLFPGYKGHVSNRA
ncbi:hypothetical protein YC2023_062230 [Brassica napus]